MFISVEFGNPVYTYSWLFSIFNIWHLNNRIFKCHFLFKFLLLWKLFLNKGKILFTGILYLPLEGFISTFLLSICSRDWLQKTTIKHSQYLHPVFNLHLLHFSNFNCIYLKFVTMNMSQKFKWILATQVDNGDISDTRWSTVEWTFRFDGESFDQHQTSTRVGACCQSGIEKRQKELFWNVCH